MTTWQEDLEQAVNYHGHLCGGQILGLRMAKLGLKLLGLKQGDDLRDLVLFLESDRCIADAAYVVTGLTLGKRRLKVMPYGKTAMSFLDLKTGQAFRISVKMKQRPEVGSDLVEFWSKYQDEEVFEWQEVEIDLPAFERPGKPISVVDCQRCGDEIMDCREVTVDGLTLCKACVEGAYYRRPANGQSRR
jgi:Formylmethanofuran dehydrogenase subunit E